MKNFSAIIPVAGIGSRFLPTTKIISKELLPIFDRPAIEIIVENLVKSGVKKIIFILPPGKKMTINHFLPNKNLEKILKKRNKKQELEKISKFSKIEFCSVEQIFPKGDGDAILAAEKFFTKENKNFFIFFGDEILENKIPAAKQLLEEFSDQNLTGEVLGIKKVKKSEISKFGIVKIKNRITENFFEIEKIVEKPNPSEAPSDLALIGKNFCSHKIFTALKKIPKKNDEIRLSDAFDYITKNGGKIFGKILTGNRFDIGNPDGLLAASVFFSKKFKKKNS